MATVELRHSDRTDADAAGMITRSERSAAELCYLRHDARSLV